MPLNWDDMAGVGRIARPHGLRGEVVVNPETDFVEDRFASGSTMYVQREGSIAAMHVSAARVHRGRPIVTFRGVESIAAAQDLTGAELRIPRDELMRLPDGSYYRHELVGCVVRTLDGSEIGAVTAVEGEVGGSRLVVAGAGGDVLIPLAADICVRIDPAGRTIVVDPPEGLLELNDSRASRARDGHE